MLSQRFSQENKDSYGPTTNVFVGQWNNLC